MFFVALALTAARTLSHRTDISELTVPEQAPFRFHLTRSCATFAMSPLVDAATPTADAQSIATGIIARATKALPPPGSHAATDDSPTLDARKGRSAISGSRTYRMVHGKALHRRVAIRRAPLG